MNLTIDDGTDDEGEVAIMLTHPDGATYSYPYEDSGERADQLYNARREAQRIADERGLTIVDYVH